MQRDCNRIVVGGPSQSHSEESEEVVKEKCEEQDLNLGPSDLKSDTQSLDHHTALVFQLRLPIWHVTNVKVALFTSNLEDFFPILTGRLPPDDMTRI